MTGFALNDIVSHAMREYEPRPEATYDTLTGLLDKDSFDEILGQFIEFAPGGFSLLMMNLDNFKDTNDSEGHVKADEKLRLIGEILQDLREGTPARRSGDEFFILLPNVTTQEQLEAVIERIQVLFIGKDLKISIGGKRHEEGETAEELEQACDMLMTMMKNTNVENAFSYEQHLQFNGAFEIFDINGASPSQIARLYRNYLRRRAIEDHQ